jgi:predicted heme/steroid binding protein
LALSLVVDQVLMMAEPWRSGYHTAAAFVPPEESSAAHVVQRNYTLAQLAATPAALSLRGVVYDVSSAPDVYGPEGTYSALVGHDASYAFAKSSKDAADLDKFDLSSLSARENMTLNGWAEMLEAKGCSTLGRLVQPPAPRPLRVRELAEHSGTILVYSSQQQHRACYNIIELKSYNVPAGDSH